MSLQRPPSPASSTAPEPTDWLSGLLRQAAAAGEPADDGFSDAVLRALPPAEQGRVGAAEQVANGRWGAAETVANGLWGAAFWRPVVAALGLALLWLCVLALEPQWQALLAWGAVLAQQPQALAEPRLVTQALEPLLALAAPLGLWLWWSLSLVQERWPTA